jgi:hypothetical protein
MSFCDTFLFCEGIGNIALFLLYLIPVILIFMYLFFVLFLYLLPVSLVPALHPTIQSGVLWFCTWYFYHTIALGCDFPHPFVLF